MGRWSRADRVEPCALCHAHTCREGQHGGVEVNAHLAMTLMLWVRERGTRVLMRCLRVLFLERALRRMWVKVVEVVQMWVVVTARRILLGVLQLVPMGVLVKSSALAAPLIHIRT